MQPASGDLILSLDLEETTGTTFADGSGYGNLVTAPVAGLGLGAAGHSGKAVGFLGGVLTAASPNKMPDSPQIALEAWVRPDAPLTGTRTILNKAGAWSLKQVGAEIRFTATGATVPTVPCVVTSTGAPLAAGVWAHVAGWYDGLQVAVVVNGIQRAVASCPNGPVVASAPGALTIGGLLSGTTVTEDFSGRLDELRVRKTAQATFIQRPGGIVGVSYFVANTRQALVDTNSVNLASFTVDKKSPSSFLLIDGTISGRGNYSGDMQQGWKYGNGAEVLAQSVMYEQNIHSKIYSTKAIVAGHATTGPQTLVFRYFTQSGAGGNRPFQVYNPNASDDNRMGQTQSVYTVWEIEP